MRKWSAFDYNAIATNVTEFTFSRANVQALIRKYSEIHYVSDDEREDILEEYSSFKFLVAEKLKEKTAKDFNSMLSIGFSNDEFSKMAYLVEICGTFQANSADCERGFSIMNTIKSKIRNRLETSHLDCLMRIKLQLNAGIEIDLDAVYNFWSKNKCRREKN